ncbi:thermonuclease family protein [Thiolapillus sp.]
MKTLFSVYLLLFSSLLTAAGTQVELVKVEDADTLVVKLDGREDRIQLLGVDAPEDTQNPKLKVDMARTGLSADELLPLGHEATEYLRALTKPDDTLLLSGDRKKRDRYGRIAAEVRMANGLSINTTLVAAGYARPLKPETLPEDMHKRLQQAWQQASRQKLGLWASQPARFEAWVKVQK